MQRKVFKFKELRKKMGLNLEFLNRMEKVRRGEHIYVRAKYGPSNPIKMPTRLNKDLACLVGIIIGDGTLRKDKQRIVIELTDRKLLESVNKLIKKTFEKDVKIHERKDRRPNRKLKYYLSINNAAIYDLMNLTFKIPKGKKSEIVTTPDIIMNSSKKIKKSYILGIMATDGGKRWWKNVGFSSSSKGLRDTVSNLLREINVEHKLDEWTYKRYKKQYYGLYFKRENLAPLKRECRSGQTGWILKSFMKKIQKA